MEIQFNTSYVCPNCNGMCGFIVDDAWVCAECDFDKYVKFKAVLKSFPQYKDDLAHVEAMETLELQDRQALQTPQLPALPQAQAPHFELSPVVAPAPQIFQPQIITASTRRFHETPSRSFVWPLLKFAFFAALIGGGVAAYFKFSEPAPVLHGIIGEEIHSGNVMVEVRDLGVEFDGGKGVNVVGVFGFVGNVGSTQLTSPGVEVCLFDTSRHQYNPTQQQGKYAVGVEMSPLLKLFHEWAFILPKDATFATMQFKTETGATFLVDLQRRTEAQLPELAGEEKAGLVEMHDMIRRLAGKKTDAEIAALNKTADQLAKNRDDAQESLDGLRADLTAAKKALVKADKHQHGSNEFESSALAKWNDSKIELENAKQAESDCAAILRNTRHFSREEITANTNWNRSVQALERATLHESEKHIYYDQKSAELQPAEEVQRAAAADIVKIQNQIAQQTDVVAKLDAIAKKANDDLTKTMATSTSR